MIDPALPLAATQPQPQPQPPRLPDIHVDKIALPNADRARTVYVVREDLLPGGTKQRAATPFLGDQLQAGISTFIYASPFAGFAQVALAVSAESLGAETLLFCEKAPGRGQRRFHHFSELARSFGASIVLCEDLAEAELKAEQAVRETRQALKIPLGFDCDCFKRHMHSALEEQWEILLSKLQGRLPRQLWVSVGSGTLVRILREVVPAEVRLRAVDVRVLAATDARIAGVGELPNTILDRAPEDFKDAALVAPDIPSNLNYDAKVWQFLCRYADDGDVWWNVAR